MAVTDDARCQAAAMDAAVRAQSPPLPDDDLVTPCDELAEAPVGDFVLCAGCADALDGIMAAGEAGLRKHGTDMIKAAFPPEAP